MGAARSFRKTPHGINSVRNSPPPGSKYDQSPAYVSYFHFAHIHMFIVLRTKRRVARNGEFLQVCVRPGIGPVDRCVGGESGQPLGQSGQLSGGIRGEATEGLQQNFLSGADLHCDSFLSSIRLIGRDIAGLGSQADSIACIVNVRGLGFDGVRSKPWADGAHSFRSESLQWTPYHASKLHQALSRPLRLRGLETSRRPGTKEVQAIPQLGARIGASRGTVLRA